MAAGPVVSDLHDSYADRLAVVEIHMSDEYAVPWGEDRLLDYYSRWCGVLVPIMMYDGYLFRLNPAGYTDALLDRLNDPTDVTIELSASENQEAVWTVIAEVCIEPGGSDKRMRIYAVDTLDHYPDDPPFSRNTLRQAAETQDVDLDAGECTVVESTFEFDDISWSQQEDIRIDRFCSSGPGGQSVNTTYSAVRLTHIPTNVVVSCQDQKSQIKNLEKAMSELRTRLYNLEYQKYLDSVASQRKTMVSTGDRSAKIRTYNYPQGRVTDHRINLTMYNLPSILDGNIHDIISQLQMAENAERLKATAIV